MPEISSHTPGTFCWPELVTTDRAAAVTFYRALLGWDLAVQPAGQQDVYSMFQTRGKSVAAAYTMRAEERDQGAPPHWNVYVSVTSADKVALGAEDLGGMVLVPPFDVFDVGRMAVVKDPTGATFSVWQPRRHIGAEIIREPNTLCWTELLTPDPTATGNFYTQLFGWEATIGQAGPFPYTEFSVDGTLDSGMMPINPEWGPVPPQWLSYFLVADCDRSAAKTTELGGKVVIPPTDIPDVGRSAVVRDPQGAMFGLFAGAP